MAKDTSSSRGSQKNLEYMKNSKDWLNANKQITTKSSTPLSKKCFGTIKRKFSKNEINGLIHLSEYVYHL